jgi:CRISPR-associated protein Csm1
MDTQLEHIVLAAFLHDIGKVMQRAEVPISAGTTSLMNTAGPSRDGLSTHYHVQWTSEFFEEYLGAVGLAETPTFDQHASRIAFKHHNPSTPWEWIVAEADRMASGMERGEAHYERNVHKRKRMVPVRSLLTLGDKPLGSLTYAPLCRLTSKDDRCNPFPLEKNDADLVSEYKKLWEEFIVDWKKNSFRSFSSNLAYLNTLFERFFWSAPASTIDDIPDNSIYEHSQSVAAIASCLYAYHTETQSFDPTSIKDRNASKYLLVHADISGIQKYIFAIAHAGGGKVAKRLRARSFMVGRIPQILAQQIITALGLPFFSIILSAGGKFHLLLPNTPNTIDVLQKKRTECQAWLHTHFQGLLTLNMASVSLTGQDFFQKRIGEKFSEVAELLQVKKFQPLESSLLQDGRWNEDSFVMPNATIQQESSSGLYDIEPAYAEDALGQRLPKANCMAIYPGTQGDFPILGWSFSIGRTAAEFTPGFVSLISFERGTEDSCPDKSIPVFYEYRASHIPQSNGEILSFEEIGQASKGRKAVGYLKADVDNLGFLLQKGLDWNAIGWTLSKMTSFSRSMEFFFAGRVEALLAEEPYQMIYTVFSGGDDVFLVGPWNTIHDFALRLREEFSKYTGENPHLTLSAGITIQRPLTPVWQASAQTDEAEKSAKTEEAFSGNSTKNQLCSFNHLIPWDEANYVFNEIDQVDEWLQQGELSSSMAQNFIYFSELAKDYHAKTRNVEGLRYIPLLSYAASRNLKKESPVMTWIPRLQDVDGKAIRHLGYIANYCLNLNRKS